MINLFTEFRVWNVITDVLAKDNKVIFILDLWCANFIACSVTARRVSFSPQESFYLIVTMRFCHKYPIPCWVTKPYGYLPNLINNIFPLLIIFTEISRRLWLLVWQHKTKHHGKNEKPDKLFIHGLSWQITISAMFVNTQQQIPCCR